ncbi:MAG: anti-sigma factor [Ramlibacter sp.]|nr:anti-sigma factor [Ramlibacter sp.]
MTHPPTPGRPPDEDELHALVDGRLAPWAASALQDQMAGDAAAQDTVAAWRAQREALRARYADVAAEPLPATFLAAAQELVDGQARRSQWWRWGGVAASVLCAFVLGWFSSTVWRPGAAGTLASGNPVRQFARQAAVAHAVYLPEVRHPVEVPAAQQEHLVQWLSKRLGRPLKIPNLAPQGFELVGGRLLPGEAGARAQFMFQNTGGERITLYVGSVSAGSKANVKETAFRFLDDGPTPGFYWVDQGFGYALSGKLPRQTLLALATAVYQQL